MSPAPPEEPSDSAGYSTFRGAWRGPIQFEMSLNGIRNADAHAIAGAVIEIRSDGEVVGQATSSGCKFSGLAAHIAPYLATLDVSLKGCRDDRFNARYSGQFGAILSAKEVRMHLVALVSKPSASLTAKMQQVSVEAVLKR
ncbi:MAG: hypothetical protein ABI330_17745 [Caldimonas sp.]